MSPSSKSASLWRCTIRSFDFRGKPVVIQRDFHCETAEEARGLAERLRAGYALVVKVESIGGNQQ